MISEVAQKKLLEIPDVNVLYVKNGKLMVGTETRAIPVALPQTVEDLKVEWFYAGEIHALDITGITAVNDRRGKWRPAPGGVSIGHGMVTAGTLGMVVVKDGKRVIISNNHVLAACNQGGIGDPIYQPGIYDGGGGNDIIGTLYDYMPIGFHIPDNGNGCPIANAFVGLCNTGLRAFGRRTRLKATKKPMPKGEWPKNYADVALCLPNSDDDILDEILEVGIPTKTGQAAEGYRVWKSGRTTGLTSSYVLGIDATVQVSYGSAGNAMFYNQVLCRPELLAGGDSGSVVVLAKMDTVVGLGFAGSTEMAVMNEWSEVDKALGGLELPGQE